MKTRHLLMGAALTGAAALVVFGDRMPSGSDVAEAVERRAPAAGAAAATVAPAPAPQSVAAPLAAAPRAGKSAAPEVSILRLISRAELVGESGEGSFGGTDGVFGSQNWTPPPPPPLKPPPPPPPSAPPLPFTYLGKAAADGVWEVFLARGVDRTYVVRNQTVIDGVYRVDAIAPPMLKLTYLPLNQVQQLNIGVPD
jgi:hypothetical protein